MKKKLLLTLICIVLMISILGCVIGVSEVKKGTNILEKDEKLIFSITSVNNDCIPVKLSVYDDGSYELYIEYKACKQGKVCNLILTYTKAIKGAYNYDVKNIIDNIVQADNETYSKENLPKYEIYMGNSYVENGYDYYYAIEKDQTNKYLDTFLNQININLDTCAEPKYID